MIRLRAALAALLFAICFTLPAVSHAQITPLISATVGGDPLTSNLGYFVLDFDDLTPTPERYAFRYNYTGRPTDADLLILLSNTLTGDSGFKQAGAENNFVTLLGYNGRTRPIPTDDPNGYWNFWLSDNGVDWVNSQFGVQGMYFSDTPDFVADANGMASRWHGARWTIFDPNNPTAIPPAPRTPFAASAAAPEPGTVAFLLPIAALLIARRRRS